MSARPWMRWAIAAPATAFVLWAMARASAVSLPHHEAGESRLRLSLTARPERIEVCRELSAEELARLEVHMRLRVQCDGRFATYTLRVESDGKLLSESAVHGAGLRHDRPIYLLRDFSIGAGRRHLRVTLQRRERVDSAAATLPSASAAGSDTGLFAGRGQRETIERARRARAAIPARLVLDTTVVFEPGRVRVLTWDVVSRSLVFAGKQRRRL